MTRPRSRPLLHAAGGVLVLAAAVALIPSIAQGGDTFDERSGNVFFREPDTATARRIETLIGTMSAGSPSDRAEQRRELAEIGYWAVTPLREALAEMDAPVQCAAILTLENIRDPRAIDSFHAAIVERDAHPYVAAFASLALGRFRHDRSVAALRESLDSPKSMALLRAAVPLAAARIRTPEAGELVADRLGSSRFQQRRVRAARLIALGFFPSLALAEGGPAPSEELEAALGDDKYDVREAAVLSYLVATHGRTDTKSRLFGLLDPRARSNVQIATLTGLSSYEGSDVTEILADTAAEAGDDAVREAAADLLLGRGDVAALGGLRSILRKRGAGSLRARAVLALADIDDPLARKLVLNQLGDSEDLVRAAVGVAATRFRDDAARKQAVAMIEHRLKGPGEPDKTVRANLKLARQVLTGGRTDVPWEPIHGSPLFESLSPTYDERLLRLVNLRVEASLDLEKITNLEVDLENQSPTEAARDRSEGGGAPSTDDGGGGDDSGGDDGGEIDLNEPRPDVEPPDGPTGPGDVPGDPGGGPRSGGPGGKASAADGPARTNQWQELRDLKIELRDEPYFGLEDLPGNRENAPTVR